MIKSVTISVLFCLFLMCCTEPKNMFRPKNINDLVYKNTFDNPKEIHKGVLNIKKAIHKNSILFNSKDSTFTSFEKIIKPSDSFTIAIWVKPNFYGRNGTMLTLSKKLKDYPIQSSLSLYLNKNRIAVMQQGNDLRKENYKAKNNFTQYFMGLRKLNVGEAYFLVYIYKEGKVSILIDGLPYAEYENVPNLTEFTYITLGASWNKEGTKYYFNGAMDDLYIYNRKLSQSEINNLMDYTHIYQYAK